MKNIPHYLNYALENIENEVWKPVKGFDGAYTISNMGRIKRLKKKSKDGRQLQDIIMKQYKYFNSHNGEGLAISFPSSGKTKTFYVSRLVYESFYGIKATNDIILHKNLDSFDNRLENLYEIQQEDFVKYCKTMNYMKSIKKKDVLKELVDNIIHEMYEEKTEHGELRSEPGELSFDI